MPDDDGVPEKYQPEPRKCDDKGWLREQYWGDEFLSAADIAEKSELSKRHIRDRLIEFGIPRRPDSFARTNSTSPFAGFYGPGETVPDNDPSATEYDPDLAPDYKHHWRDYSASEGVADD